MTDSTEASACQPTALATGDQVTSIPQLQALPTRTVLRDHMGWISVLTDDILIDARGAYMAGNLPGVRVVWSNHLPLTVHHLPGEPDRALIELAAQHAGYDAFLREQFPDVAWPPASDSEAASRGPAAAEVARLADLLGESLFDRGREVQHWPEDEREFFRNGDWVDFEDRAEKLARLRVEKAARHVIAAGWTLSEEVRA
ncbi:hypothetical protein AB0H71_13570 [Nocardia sp. NPDC050697]|uniref:hypothetical protein n=1 Tax=Nocardia sp. NPDC050697 TaxID=3155158 RepID=UPI0033D0D33F